MQGIVLAAGQGSRLKPLTNEVPKPIVELADGSTLLGRLVENIGNYPKIDEVIVVTGYNHNMVEKFLAEKEVDADISTIENPFYDNSDNIISLWLASKLITERFILTNGDNIFDPKIIERLDQVEGQTKIAANFKVDFDSDDMKISIENGDIKNISKGLLPKNIDAESIGVTVIEDEALGQFKDSCKELVMGEGDKQSYWLETLVRMTKKDDVRIVPVDVSESYFYEMDTLQDKQQIEEALESGEAE